MSSATQTSAAVVLDLGSHGFRSLRRTGRTLTARRARAAYCTLPNSEPRRRLLDQIELPHAVADGELVLVGDAADEYARLFGTPPLALLPGGRVPADDPPARQLIATLVEALLPPGTPGTTCRLILPGDGEDAEFLSRVVKLRGYAPHAVTQTDAFATAAMAGSAYSGVLLHCGADRWQMTALLNGRTVARVVAEGGTNELDRRTAEDAAEILYEPTGGRFLDVESARRARESFRGSLAKPEGEAAERNARLHTAAVAEVVREAAARFAGHRVLRRLTTPMPVYLSGGAARIAGFRRIVAAVLAEVPLPFPTGDLHAAPESEYVAARGALIGAELDGAGELRRAA